MNKLSRKPHEKSFSLGQLALRIATIPARIAEVSMHSAFDVATVIRAEAKSMDELLGAHHHRGQLTVYLRETGALVPAIYGGSADEVPFQL